MQIPTFLSSQSPSPPSPDAGPSHTDGLHECVQSNPPTIPDKFKVFVAENGISEIIEQIFLDPNSKEVALEFLSRNAEKGIHHDFPNIDATPLPNAGVEGLVATPIAVSPTLTPAAVPDFYSNVWGQLFKTDDEYLNDLLFSMAICYPAKPDPAHVQATELKPSVDHTNPTSWEEWAPGKEWPGCTEEDFTAAGFQQISRGLSPSGYPRTPAPTPLPFHNHFSLLDPPSPMQVNHPKQTNIVGENSSPAIYAPSHNISVTPHIYITPERVFASPATQKLLTPPKSAKASPPEVKMKKKCMNN